MTMKYKLIKDCLKGFVLTREPETVTGKFVVSFIDAPDGATAVFENGSGNSLYRILKDESCAIPASFLSGRVRVTVTVLNGKETAPKYICEGIYTKALPSGGVLVCADGLDICRELIGAYSELQEIRDIVVALRGDLDALNEKVARLMDGYDFE